MTEGAPTARASLDTHRVCVGDFRVAGAGERLVIHGLGSCVAVLLHDPTARLSALGHVLLPKPPSPDAPGAPGRFASTAVPAMVKAMDRRGGDPSRLLAKVAGGSQMFQYERAAEQDPVGTRNLQAALRILERLGIPVTARDTGGSYGRTVTVDGASGRMEVRAVWVEQKVL